MSEHDADPYAQFNGHPEPGSVTRRGNPRPIGFNPALAAPYDPFDGPFKRMGESHADPFARLQAAIKEKHRRRVRERWLLIGLTTAMWLAGGIAVYSYFRP